MWRRGFVLISAQAQGADVAGFHLDANLSAAKTAASKVGNEPIMLCA